jgi:galactose mutarotase-like enzyme
MERKQSRNSTLPICTGLNRFEPGTQAPPEAGGVEWHRDWNTLSAPRREIREADSGKFDCTQEEWIEMKVFVRLAVLYPFALPVLMACALAPAIHAQAVTEIGGEKIVTLSRTAVSATKPEFTSIVLAPGRGMEIVQITANFPGKGNVDVLASPDLAGAKKMLDVDDDGNGDLGYRLGAAFLFPYPNRIRGPLSADGKTLTTEWQGHTISIPANNIGKLPGAERHALHGLILKAKAENVAVKDIPGGQQVTGVVHGGDFGGRWFSKSDLYFTITLAADAVDASIVAKNVGSAPEPVSIGWHPYFNLPSGDRTQARLRIPAAKRAEVDNYDNVFTTGKLTAVDGTPFDFRAPGGKALGNIFLDDNWSDLTWKAGATTVQVIDPAAHYGVDIEGISPEIKTIQAYAPPTAKFIAVEHQFNFADPFGKEWGTMDTGMVTLKPGESTKWHVRLHVFVP